MMSDHQKFSVGQALTFLRKNDNKKSEDLCAALNISHATYLKTERDQRDLSFIMALRVCQYYNLGIDELIAMIDEAALERKDLASVKAQLNRQRKQLERAANRIKK